MTLDLALNFLISQEYLVLEVHLHVHFLQLAQLLGYIHTHQLSETDILIALQAIQLPMPFPNLAISEHLEEGLEMKACL